MQTDRALDGIDSRFALTVYAAGMWVVGLSIALWGSLWVQSPSLNGLPWGVHSVVRMTGAVIVAFACAATAAARVSDPVDRSRFLGGFALGHLVVFLMAFIQNQAIWSNLPDGQVLLGERIVLGIGVPATWLLYSWTKRDGDLANALLPFLRLRSVETKRLRSAYDEHIRKAAIQEERSRVARDLHDSIKQQIFVVQTSAATAQARIGVDIAGASASLEQIRESARDAMTEMDTMLDQLRAPPLENLGLVSALKGLAEATSIRTGICVQCEFGDLPPSTSLPPGAHAELLRVGQEALANVARHARASHVGVILKQEDKTLVLRITDDGNGFDSAEQRRGMGLRNIRERAEGLGGTMSVTSAPATGSTIVVSIPVMVRGAAGYPRRLLLSALILVAWIALFWFGELHMGLWPFAFAGGLDLLRHLHASLHSRR